MVQTNQLVWWLALSGIILQGVARGTEWRGTVEDCLCTKDSLEAFCLQAMDSTLKELVQNTSIRYYHVDYLRDCPFWVEDYLCQAEGGAGGGGCGLCPCDDEEVPPAWRREDRVCADHLPSQPSVRVTPLDVAPSAEKAGASKTDEWVVRSPPEHMAYINLVDNPERYTGFSGYNASRIWMAIYKENCFKGPQANCLEERVFYRLISGFHTSTTAHICEHYANVAGEQQPNLEYYRRAVAAFPDRVMNVYFAYAFVLRAVHAAAEQLQQGRPFSTGIPEEDARTMDLVGRLLAQADDFHHCSGGFDSNELFAAFPEPDRATLLADFRAKFRNISEILDCVGCESCRVHAKLQIHGIGTALRVLLAPVAGLPRPELARNDLVALLNTLYKFGESIQIIRRMEVRLNSPAHTLGHGSLAEDGFCRVISPSLGFLVVVAMWLCFILFF